MYSVTANIELLSMNIILVSLLFGFNLRNWKPKVINPLSSIYLLIIVGSILEMLAFWVDGKAELRWLNYLSNILYLGSISLMSCSMLQYSNDQFPRSIWKNSTQHILVIFPVLLEMVGLVTAPWTGLIFSVDEAGFYHRGDTFYLQLIPYGYLLLGTVYGMYWYAKSQTTREKNRYLAIAAFALPPFLLGGTQLMIKANTLDILEFSIVVSLIADYAVSQNNRITRDCLTGLHNREALDAFLQSRIQDAKRDGRYTLHVAMGDMDGFKQINDIYGHVEGDWALHAVAEVLQRVCPRYNAAPARFGGDEFTILINPESEQQLQELLQEIDEGLLEASKSKPYTLCMSIGCAALKPSDSVTDILKAADKALYQVKRARKAAR